MKRIIFFLTSVMMSLGAFAQTLQSVTNAGNTTTNNIAIGISTPAVIGSSIITLKGDTNSNIIAIPTLQGLTATGSDPYGHFFHTISQSFVNSDGQRDAVYQWGYNHNGVGGKVNANEAEIHHAIESHYIGGGTSGSGDFEVHLESHSKDNNPHRHFSMNIHKNDGQAVSFWEVENMNWYRNNQGNSGTPYFSINQTGAIGVTGSSAIFNITRGTSTLRLEPYGDINGGVGITASGSGASPYLSVLSPTNFSTSSYYPGNGFPYTFESTSSVLANVALFSSTYSGGAFIKTIGTSTTGNTSQGYFNVNNAANATYIGTGGTATGAVTQNRGYVIAESNLDGLHLASNKSTGEVNMYVGGSLKMKINSNGLSVSSLTSGGSAPTTSGTTKMVITDANGLLSFGSIPSGSDFIQNQTATTQTAGFKINGTAEAGTLKGSALTSGRIALIGTGGAVVDDGDLTWNTSTNTLTVTGNESVQGNLDVAQDLAVNSHLAVGTTPSVYTADILGDVKIVGTGTASGDALEVTGSVHVNGSGTYTGTWTTSDKRFKRDVEELPDVRTKILSLAPKQYYFRTESFPGQNFDTKQHFGFLAQDLEKVFPNLTKKDKNGFYAVNYVELVPLLVQALKEEDQVIKEQSANLALANSKITDLESKLATLELMINTCCEGRSKTQKTVDGNAVNQPKSTLDQNIPNPTNGETVIGFNIVGSYNQAFIGVYDLNGRQIKRVSIAKGSNNISFERGAFLSGQYVYSLIVDNTIVDSKKMVVIE